MALFATSPVVSSVPLGVGTAGTPHFNHNPLSPPSPRAGEQRVPPYTTHNLLPSPPQVATGTLATPSHQRPFLLFFYAYKTAPCEAPRNFIYRAPPPITTSPAVSSVPHGGGTAGTPHFITHNFYFLLLYMHVLEAGDICHQPMPTNTPPAPSSLFSSNTTGISCTTHLANEMDGAGMLIYLYVVVNIHT